MSFYERPKPPMPKPKPEMPKARAGERGSRMPMDYKRPVPEHRRHGLTNEAVLNRQPNGCLFEVPGAKGWFDLDGYWCVMKAAGPEVRRGAQRKVMRLLSKDQKKALERARLRARREGLR